MDKVLAHTQGGRNLPLPIDFIERLKAAPGHQLDVVAVLLADDALVVELVDGAFDADDVIFNG